MALRKPALGGLCAKLRPMNKLVVGLMVISSFALADEMPKGSEQEQALRAFLDGTGGFAFFCPPENDPPGVQAFCIQNLLDEADMMPSFDASMIEDAVFTPLTQAWVKDEDDNRFTREYTTNEGGTLRAIFRPEDNQTFVFYTP